jgi:uncharacterized protein (DUF1015 family)
MSKKNATQQIEVTGFDGQIYNVTLERNKTITIDCFYKNVREPKQTIKTFSIGSKAEYDSYNLSYTGTITSITDKTITIVEDHGTTKHRLKLDQFCWRNWNFDLEKIRKENAAWTD